MRLIYIRPAPFARERAPAGDPPLFPSSEKVGKKDAPVKSRFPRRSARLRETQNSLRSNSLRFFFRKRLPARGFSTGEVPTAPSILSRFPLNRGTGSEFQGEEGRHTKKPFFSWVLTWRIFLFHYRLRPHSPGFLGNCQNGRLPAIPPFSSPAGKGGERTLPRKAFFRPRGVSLRFTSPSPVFPSSRGNQKAGAYPPRHIPVSSPHPSPEIKP